MQCDEARLKIQALADGELPEHEIDSAMEHLAGCSRCRSEYADVLRLQRKMRGLATAEPSNEWFDRLERRIGRRIGASGGQILFIASYIALVGYAFYSIFADGGVGTFLKIALAGMLLGILVLLGVTISDRRRESRDDRYKGVMK